MYTVGSYSRPNVHSLSKSKPTSSTPGTPSDGSGSTNPAPAGPPVIPQKDNYSCYPSSILNAVSQVKGEQPSTSVQELGAKIGTTTQGTFGKASENKAKDYVASQGLKTENLTVQTPQQLEEATKKGAVVMAGNLVGEEGIKPGAHVVNVRRVDGQAGTTTFADSAKGREVTVPTNIFLQAMSSQGGHGLVIKKS